MTKEEIGSILKELRIVSEKTQKEVAELLGRKQQVVGHWETGYSQPDANTLFTLCEMYGTTVDAAFGFKKKDNVFSKNDLKLFEMYHDLDPHGKEMVDFTLLKEWERSSAELKVSKSTGAMLEHLIVKAAHNDHADLQEQQELMEEDLKDMEDNW